MIIDMHVHIFERKMFPKKFLNSCHEHKKAILSENDLKRYQDDAKLETLLKDMDHAGVDMSVCLPTDLAFVCDEEPEAPIWDANEYVAEAQAKFPNRIIGFFGCDPMRPGAVAMLEKGIKELGLKGVKLFPGWYFPTDERIGPFVEKVEELGVPLLFHMGSDPAPFVMKYGDPVHLDDLLSRHPKLKIIAAHFARGWEHLMTQMCVYRPGRIWTDLSGFQYEYVYSKWYFLMEIRHILDRLQESVFFGSDWPFLNFPPFPSEEEWVNAFKDMKLPQVFLDMGMKQFTQEEKDKFLGGNIQKLLNL